MKVESETGHYVGEVIDLSDEYEDLEKFVILGYNEEREAWFAREARAEPNAPYLWIEDE